VIRFPIALSSPHLSGRKATASAQGGLARAHTSSTTMIRLTKHAVEAIRARNIAIEWVEATLQRPDWVETDPRHDDRMRAYKAIAELGGRILRVVFRRDGSDMIVITAYPDRDARP
jgi:hypothetical protein